MRKGMLAVMFCLLLLRGSAQVANDSCLSAIDLGVIEYPANGGTNCLTGIPADTVVISTTFGAQPNFPYPANTLSCSGFSTSLSIPANDVWYKLSSIVGCDLDLTFFSNDTLNVSLWIGDTCAYLIPFACFTIPSGIITNEIIPFGYLTSVYIQVSGNGLGKYVGFTMCVTTPPVYCAFAFSNSIPTPVKCFYYTKQIVDANSQTSGDGSVTINMMYGTPPFSILWADGDTNWIRTNLNPGIYHFSIQDFNGCIESDSIIIGVISGYFSVFDVYKINVYPIPSNNYVCFQLPEIIKKNLYDNYSLIIYNALGEYILSKKITTKNDLIIEKGQLPSGFYNYKFFCGNSGIYNGKFIIL